MHITVMRTITHMSHMVVEADTVGEAVKIAERANETAWSDLRRSERIYPTGATGA